MAKGYFEEVRRVVVIIVILYVIVQTSMDNVTIDTIKIFAVAAATRSGILKGEKKSSLSCTVSR